MESKKVKIKVLKHIMNWKPGDEVEVDASTADHLCAPTKVSDGNGLIVHQKAMTMKDWEELKAKEPEKGGMTQGELAAMGMKNVVETPKDPEFEKKMSVENAIKDREASDKAAKLARNKKQNAPKFEEKRAE